jgi:hypothetical protein
MLSVRNWNSKHAHSTFRCADTSSGNDSGTRAMVSTRIINEDPMRDLVVKVGNRRAFIGPKVLPRLWMFSHDCGYYRELLLAELLLAEDVPRGAKLIVSSDEICRNIAVAVHDHGSRLENMGAQLDQLTTYLQHRSASKFRDCTMLVAIFSMLLFYVTVITLRA